MMKEYICVGIMSGTSVDGVDTAVYRIVLDDENTSIELIHGKTYDINETLRREILEQMSGCENALHRLTLLNMELGELYGRCVGDLLKDAGINPADVAVIGSHGQTMYHVGKKEEFCGSMSSGTLQIGEGAVIAQRTGIPTVSDFRTADMAAGGEGAPFVPVLDRILARRFAGPVAFQNIGGIGNVGYVNGEELIAFDTGPGNMIMDHLTRLYSGGRMNYDRDGAIGMKGKLNQSVLSTWMAHPYLVQKPPKTTGRELFGTRFFQDYPVPVHVPLEDMIHTAAVYTARTIALSYRKWLPLLPGTVIVSGGGVHNPLVMKTLADELPECNVLPAEKAGISSDFKEAAAFALLGLLYVLDLPGNVPSATGADQFVITGKLSKPLPRRMMHE